MRQRILARIGEFGASASLPGGPRSFRTADPYRILSRKDGNRWQANIRISFLSSVRAAKMVVENSRAIAAVARELGISETSLGNWGVPRRRGGCHE